jgi:hypothetical protein
MKVAKPEKHFNWGEFGHFTSIYNMRVEDNRNKGGALWIRFSDVNDDINNQLVSWGFRYKPGSGWWKE